MEHKSKVISVTENHFFPFMCAAVAAIKIITRVTSKYYIFLRIIYIALTLTLDEVAVSDGIVAKMCSVITSRENRHPLNDLKRGCAV